MGWAERGQVFTKYISSTDPRQVNDSERAADESKESITAETKEETRTRKPEDEDPAFASAGR